MRWLGNKIFADGRIQKGDPAKLYADLKLVRLFRKLYNIEVVNTSGFFPLLSSIFYIDTGSAISHQNHLVGDKTLGLRKSFHEEKHYAKPHLFLRKN